MNRLKNIATFLFVKNKWAAASVCTVLLLWFWYALPDPLFGDPTSFVLEANDGSLLGAKIAADGQWRFPHSERIPQKFEKAIICFEDKRFYSHFGVDWLAFGRALATNIEQRKIVSGASTLSMQVVRMARKGKPRTIAQKIVEMILATRMEISYSKKEILALYTSNAPFGGNVVGLEAATWRYYGKRPELLTWSEAATMAVLPNAPSLIRPGRNQQRLLAKRNRLLKKLFDRAAMDAVTYELAIAEPLPTKPHALPAIAPHLLERAFRESKGRGKKGRSRLRSTIDKELQNSIRRIADQHHKTLKNNSINNLAVLVLDVKANAVLAYIGNAENAGTENAGSVDIVTSPRSTGSILKPILYAQAQQEGLILPQSLIPDIPTYLQNYRPENFSKTYDGAVPANKALSRSLNIPFVRLLQDYGVEKFHFDLKKSGITTLPHPPGHYGLTLILGGSEATLWDLTNIYSSMAKRLGGFYPNDGMYNETDFKKATYSKNHLTEKNELSKETKYLTADAIWLTFEAMKDLERPDNQGGWEQFRSSRQIAWKTGTSYGFRDAWAIGVTPKYAVGIWAGNADGEGRPGLTGISAAAPILFDVFDQLPNSTWFDQPFDAMQRLNVCKLSGHLPKAICETDTVWCAKPALNSKACPYHRLVHLDESQTWQVDAACEDQATITTLPWFVLPPVEEYYYKPKHPNHRPLPPFKQGCNAQSAVKENPIQIVYPDANSIIYVPIGLDGTSEKTVFKVVHRSNNARVHWHLDKEYIGSTMDFHLMELNPASGGHTLTVVDDAGNRMEVKFQILPKDMEQG